MATLQGDYEPSPAQWVRDQVAEYEASGGTRANTLLDTGMPIIVVTSRGAKSGKLRKNPLMRVEHDGTYALVASKGGAPEDPEWFYNLVAHPDEVTIQDGPEPFAVTVRQIEGDERAEWWERAVDGLPALRRVPAAHRSPHPGLLGRSGRRRVLIKTWPSPTPRADAEVLNWQKPAGRPQSVPAGFCLSTRAMR